MNTFIFFGAFMFISILGSNKLTDCDRFGNIVGWDARRCSCCEGWRIEVDEHSFLCDSIPNAKENFGPIDKWEFPIPIYLNYKKAKKCPDTRIEIICIKKR